MKYALITIIENNDNLHEGEKDFRPLKMEDEAVLCFRSWRKNGGKFKDIPIYAMCPTKRIPSKECIKKIKEFDVKYIEYYIPETDNFTCGFWNVPVGCSWLEENIEEDFLIHIDLDMCLLKPPPESLFYCEKDVLARIGTISGKRYHRTIANYDLNFETCFINSWRENRFYKKWYDYLNEIEPKIKNTVKRYSEIEEHVIDILYHEGIEKIEPVDSDFQFGSWYPVRHIKNIQNTYFRHEHLVGDYCNTTSKKREFKNYINRINKEKNK